LLRDDGRVEPQPRPRPVAEPERVKLVGVRVDPPAGDVEGDRDIGNRQ
jgi:hypothetical protein